MAHSVVIGGAGFVGSWVVDEILKDSNSRVTIIDNLISSEKWNISTDPRVRFIEGSAAESATFDKINEPVDFLYQLACFHGNQSSIARPIDDLENGLKTTLVSLEWVKNNSRRTRVIYSGAGCAVAHKTWDTPAPVKELEVTSLIHDSPYSISKITGEMYCHFYKNQYDLDVIRVRFQNIYGPREILGAGKWRGNASTIWRNAIPTFIFKALNNFPIQLYAGNVATRDFVYVSDLAEGVLAAAIHGVSGEVYNLASGKEYSISSVLDTIINITNSNSKIDNLPPREWDSSGRRYGDPTKSQKLLGFKTSTNLKDGLEKTVTWTNQNLNAIVESIEKHNFQK